MNLIAQRRKDLLEKNRVIELFNTSFSNSSSNIDQENQNQTSFTNNQEQKQVSSSHFIMSSQENSKVDNDQQDSSQQNDFSESEQQQILNLSQTDIQRLVMSMFQLFIQNTQSNSASIVIQTAFRNNFRAQNVKFLDSQLNMQFEKDDVMQIERDTYYRDVFLFVKRIKNQVMILKADIVRSNLFTCLRDVVQT